MPRRPLFVALLVGSFASGCADVGAGPGSTATAAEIRTMVVEPAPWTPSLTLDGTLAPIASVQLGFDVPGRMDTLVAHRGSVVHKGEVLASLDDRMPRAQMAQAEAGVAAAEAQLAAGEASWGRAQQLRVAGGMSDQQYKDAEAGILAGRAGVDQARAALALARTHLANHTLRAPISGTITNGPDNVGMMVGAGTPIFLLEDLSALQLKGSVSEADGWVAEGMSATLTSGAPGSAASGQGVVSRVIPALDPSTRRLPVEVRLDGAPAGFLAHSYARATISAAAPVAVLSVPRAAIVARPDFSVVRWREGAYERVPVEVLTEDTERSLVRGALAAGDAVVLYPPPGLGGGE
ncbi:MAG: efflux RND transporter periplasmic adaptor subunit [Myxococcales bacterium]|nr:efflux RND transporter periplasmic adaptor subunit [Myxococcales bacterium]